LKKTFKTIMALVVALLILVLVSSISMHFTNTITPDDSLIIVSIKKFLPFIIAIWLIKFSWKGITSDETKK